MSRQNKTIDMIYMWICNCQVKRSHRGLTRINSFDVVQRAPRSRRNRGGKKGRWFQSREKDKGSAFIARERFPYFLLVALVRPAIDKANPLPPLLATLTLVHPLCTLLSARPRKRFEPRNALSLFVHEIVVSLPCSLAEDPIDPAVRCCLQLAKESARL